MRPIQVTCRWLLLVLALCAGQPGSAAEYPVKPIRLIIGYSAGGASDVPFRALAKAAAGALGQPIVVENRPGMGGAMPAQVLMAAAADGYTVAQFSGPVFRMPHQMPVDWDPVTDFDYVIAINAYSGSGLVVRHDSPFRSIDEFMDYARAHPGALSYATPGPMTALHLMMEDLAETAGITLQHVPFKGDAQALPAVMGGHVAAAAATPSWRAYVDAGQMRLLLGFDDARNPRYPDVPSIVERRLAQPERTPLGIAVRAGTDPAIVQRLHDAFARAMADPDFLATQARFDMMPAYQDTASYRAYARDKFARERLVVARHGQRQP